MKSYLVIEENMRLSYWGYRKAPVIIRVMTEDESILNMVDKLVFSQNTEFEMYGVNVTQEDAKAVIEEEVD